MNLSWNVFERNTAEKLGEMLHFERVRKGMSLKEVSLTLNVDKNKIDNLELGLNNPDLKIIFELAQLYNCKMMLSVCEYEEGEL